jgi:hypothetical protein
LAPHPVERAHFRDLSYLGWTIIEPAHRVQGNADHIDYLPRGSIAICAREVPIKLIKLNFDRAAEMRKRLPGNVGPHFFPSIPDILKGPERGFRLMLVHHSAPVLAWRMREHSWEHPGHRGGRREIVLGRLLTMHR